MLLMEYAMAPGVLASAVKTPQLMGTLSKAKSLKISKGYDFGSSMHFLDPNKISKETRGGITLVKKMEGYTDIFVHSNGTNFQLANGTWVTPKVFAQHIRDTTAARGEAIGPIRLFACDSAGLGNTAAQGLANELRVAIYAPTKRVRVLENGSFIVLDGGHFFHLQPVIK